MKALLWNILICGLFAAIVGSVMEYGFGRDFGLPFYVGAGWGLSLICDWWRARRGQRV